MLGQMRYPLPWLIDQPVDLTGVARHDVERLATIFTERHDGTRSPSLTPRFFSVYEALLGKTAPRGTSSRQPYAESGATWGAQKSLPVCK